MKRRRNWPMFALGLVLMIAGAAFLFLKPRAYRPGPIVQLDSGRIQGSIERDLVVYRGIPFAAPPVDALRWKAPQPVKPWPEIKQLKAFHPKCPQIGPSVPGMEMEETSEDCLYLNVWSPVADRETRLPVMVFIHGGGGTNGSPSARVYWGHDLARRGVIVVSLSYRLGTLGYLAHPELTAEAGTSGNYGLLDLIAGLHWVQRNVAALGGDPGNVTLFGQSAGAYYASELMISPLASGLFQRVIGQSGADLWPAGTRQGMPTLADAEQAGVEFARSLGVSSIRELRQIPADKILAAARPPIGRAAGFRLPIVDGFAIPEDPYAAYRNGSQQPVALLVGYNAVEGKNMVEQQQQASEFIAEVRATYGDYADKVLAEYPARTDQEAIDSQWRLKGETAIDWPVATWARLHARKPGTQVYVYRFDVPPPIGPLRKIGAAHGAEIPYVFGLLPVWSRYLFQLPPGSSRDVEVADEIPTYWTNFAKTGDPNGATVPAWPSFSRERKVLNFGSSNSYIDLPDAGQHAVMDGYVEKFYQSRAGASEPGGL